MFTQLYPRILVSSTASPCRKEAAISNRWVRQLCGRVHSPPRRFPTTGFDILDTPERLEEQRHAWYDEGAYYPVRIGDVLQSRYQVLGKLGYGAHSTAWLGRDLHAHRYVTLKVGQRDSHSARREVAAYQHLHSCKASHAGAQLVRQLLDDFEIESPDGHGKHMCMVHEPLGMSVHTLRISLPESRLLEDLVKSVLKHLLLALDYLHGQAKMVHADLQARNVHLRIEDESVFERFEKDELEDPSPRKLDGSRIIHQSRDLCLPKKSGPPVLCDFGEARYGQASYTDDIQSFVYRAPEVILSIPWSYAADIWNVGVLIWDLFEDKHLFCARGPDGDQLSEYHLAEMVVILGPPPLEFLQRTQTSWKYFNADGTWKAATPIPELSLETMETQLDGVNKARFLEFVRKMLLWCPEKRQTARELLDDPWLNS